MTNQDLIRELSIVATEFQSTIDMLDDASSVVDASENEMYAYERELTNGRAGLARLHTVLGALRAERRP